jgi:hypothetical protein
VPGEEVFFASARSQAHFIFSKKVPGKKCHLLPQSTLTQALNIFSVVSSPVTFLHLWRKKCLGEKSSWEPGSQVPAYYAGLRGRVERALFHPLSAHFLKENLF